MKKVLLISQEYPPRGGGAGQVAYNVAEYLKRKCIIEIVTIGPKKKVTAEQDNIISYAAFIPKFFLFTFMLEIVKKKPREFDYIILNDIGAVITASLFFPKSLVRKSLIFLHGSEPENILVSPNVLFRILNIRKRYYQILMNCKAIIAVSNYMKKKFISMSGWSELSKRIFVIPNAINPKKYYSDPIDLHRLYCISAEKYIMYSASRITEKKGYRVMYQMFKQLVKENIPYHWIVSGEGDYLETLKSQCLDDGLLDRITFTGYLNQNDLRQYYSSSDIFVLLSEYDEAFGLVYLEASACGLPSIAMKRGGTSEAVLDGKTGFLVENADECQDILRDYQYKNLSKRELRAFSEKYISSNIYDKLWELLI